MIEGHGDASPNQRQAETCARREVCPSETHIWRCILMYTSSFPDSPCTRRSVQNQVGSAKRRPGV
jgi:hypothetical protein